MFGAMRSSQRRRDNSNRSSSPMSRSEKNGFVAVFCILFILGGVLLSDFIALTTQHVNSAVINKEYLPPSHGQTSTGASYGVSEKWQLSVEINEEAAKIYVAHEFYDQVHRGDILKVSYTRSRIFHEIKIVSVTR